MVNSVSFRTGRKFENHRSDHYKLREISDQICKERNLSVLPPSKFTGSRKKGYWIRKSGNLTHRDLLKQDVEQILPLCGNWSEFEKRLRSLGYQFPRDQSYDHISITAPGWKRSVRLDGLGYTDEVLEKRFYQNRDSEAFYELRYTAYYKVKTYPLLNLERQLDYEITHSKDTAVVLVDVLFYILLQLLHLTRNEEQQKLGNHPHSPAIRQSLTMEKQLTAEYTLLKNNDLHTETDILDFIDSRTDEIAFLEKERQTIRNSNRRPKSPEERAEKNAAAREISKKLKPLRKDLKLAEAALQRYPQVWELLQAEHETERNARNRNRERGR